MSLFDLVLHLFDDTLSSVSFVTTTGRDFRLRMGEKKIVDSRQRVVFYFGGWSWNLLTPLCKQPQHVTQELGLDQWRCLANTLMYL
jgi:hypothetical protein